MSRIRILMHMECSLCVLRQGLIIEGVRNAWASVAWAHLSVGPSLVHPMIEEDAGNKPQKYIDKDICTLVV